LTIEQANGNADFTVSITGAVRTKSSLRVDAEIQARGDLRIYDSADESHYANIVYGASTENTTVNIPANGTAGALVRTMALLEQAQTFTAVQTFPHLGIKLNNDVASHVATFQFGTAANRTYTFSGDSGTVWTSGNLEFPWNTIAADQDTFVADGRIQVSDGFATFYIPYMDYVQL
jgi:hypothetical protein